MPVGIESIYLKALTADFWLNTGTVTSVAEIAAIDSRFTALPAFKEKHIYNNNKRVSRNGGNDYWENGCINPDIILKDMVSIMHPGLFPGWELVYYQKIK
jgi:iron complex transport system substrate-binding protein